MDLALHTLAGLCYLYKTFNYRFDERLNRKAIQKALRDKINICHTT